MAQTRQNKAITQLDKANSALKAMAVNVTAEDRKAAMEQLNFSRWAIGFYLKGEAKDLDMATKLVKFLKNRIQERDKELSH